MKDKHIKNLVEAALSMGWNFDIGTDMEQPTREDGELLPHIIILYDPCVFSNKELEEVLEIDLVEAVTTNVKRAEH